jgi:hypothetical protein
MRAVVQRNVARNNRLPAFRASRKDEPVRCASCGREVRRRTRQQRFCSTRCRKRDHYAQNVRKGVFSGVPVSDIPLGTHTPKNENTFKALQWAKSRSSNRIFGPAQVLAVEVFERPWQQATSSGGVAIQVGRLRERALVGQT